MFVFLAKSLPLFWEKPGRVGRTTQIFLHLHKRQTPQKCTLYQQIHVNGFPIENVQNKSFLGLITDSKLS